MVRCVYYIVDELLYWWLFNIFKVVIDVYIKDERFIGIRRLEYCFEKVQGKLGFEVFILGFKQGKFGRLFGVKVFVFGIDIRFFQFQVVKNLDGFQFDEVFVSQLGSDNILCELCVWVSGRVDGSGIGFIEDVNSFIFYG